MKNNKKILAAEEKFRNINLYEPVFHTRVDFCVGPEPEMKKWLQKNKLGDGPERFWDLNGFYNTYVYKEKGLMRRVVWVRAAANFYALFHEVIHLTVDIFRDAGMLFSLENEETIAYLQTHWFRSMWRVMGNWNEENIKLKKSAENKIEPLT